MLIIKFKLFKLAQHDSLSGVGGRSVKFSHRKYILFGSSLLFPSLAHTYIVIDGRYSFYNMIPFSNVIEQFFILVGQST